MGRRPSERGVPCTMQCWGGPFSRGQQELGGGGRPHALPEAWAAEEGGVCESGSGSEGGRCIRQARGTERGLGQNGASA